MDETESSGNGWDAWAQAITGNAINAAVDRVLHRPQFGSDPAQAYGMDANGNLYTLGKANAQITAQVQTGQPAGIAGIPTIWLVIAAVAYLVTR
jgi:hypothetical protein